MKKCCLFNYKFKYIFVEFQLENKRRLLQTITKNFQLEFVRGTTTTMIPSSTTTITTSTNTITITITKTAVTLISTTISKQLQQQR